tara:strand:+ start:187 stop:990 length:804 start_codon:yes stop_codon:yes gene_type:complete
MPEKLSRQSSSSSTNRGSKLQSGTHERPAFSPLYKQIKNLILNCLRAGEWKPGLGIPSEIQLSTRYRVSQGTVRKAIDELAAENILKRCQGKGTFVSTHAEQQVQYRFLKLVSDEASTEEKGPTERQIIDCKRVRAQTHISKLLGLRSGETVIQVRRILSFRNKPTILEDIWLNGEAFKGLTATRLSVYSGPMYALFETEFEVPMIRAQEKIRSVLPDLDQSNLLKISASTPLLSVERIAFTYNDQPMEFRRGLYLTDCYHYKNELF